MATAAQIDAFLSQRRIAMLGLSVCDSDVTRLALRELLARGHDIVPIRPGVKELDGCRTYPSVFDVTGPIDGAIVFTPPCRSERVIYDCINRDIPRFWLDPGNLRGTSPDALELCERHDRYVIVGGHWSSLPHRPAAPSAPRPHRISFNPFTRLVKAGAAS